MNPDDVGFIDAVRADAQTRVLGYLLSRGVGVGTDAFDPKRLHLFGYSSGALMAYRLAHAQPDVWSSVVAVAGGNGGRNTSTTTQWRFPPNPGGTFRISTYLAVGGDSTGVGVGDDTNPPGNPALDPATDTVEFNKSFAFQAALEAAGVPPIPAGGFAYRVRKANHTIKDYLVYNRSQFTDFNDVYASPTTFGSGLVGVTGQPTRSFREWTRPSTSPRVRVEWDTAMTHTNLASAGVNRWLTAAQVWAFMKSVPRP